ncbi:MAG: hypothetical protein ACLQGP_13820 [Isosphaeraceae bacterium]
MSGPIIRRYGFPNFDKIFGDRPLEHGVEDVEPKDAPAEDTASSESGAEKPSSAKVAKGKQPDRS